MQSEPNTGHFLDVVARMLADRFIALPRLIKPLATAVLVMTLLLGCYEVGQPFGRLLYVLVHC
jgi:hypothetical protein